MAAWRHIVSLFRGQGADNVTWLWTINQDLSSTGPIASWWPGARYVTWVGIDGYYYRPSSTFATVFGQTIAQVRAFTRKPVLLSETAVGPQAGQPAKIQGLFAGMRQYQTLGLVWFDIAQHQGIYHQDWRIEDSQCSCGRVPAGRVFADPGSSLTSDRPRSGFRCVTTRGLKSANMPHPAGTEHYSFVCGTRTSGTVRAVSVQPDVRGRRGWPRSTPGRP